MHPVILRQLVRQSSPQRRTSGTRRLRRALGRPRRLQVTDDAALLPTNPRTQS
jgi:hypothetical protein